MATPEEYLVAATTLADDVLFPDALAVDRSATVPPSHLRALADAGLYGVAAPAEDGGLPADDTTTMPTLVETLASGCLTTAFVWIQHHGTVGAVAAGGRELRDRWLAPLCSGAERAGVGLAGLRSEPGLRLTRTDEGFVLNGSCPWVTGWGSISVIGIAARDDHDLIHHLLVDAVASPTLQIRTLDLVAVGASGTVTVDFADHLVAPDRLLTTRPFADWAGGDANGQTLNGFLAIGLAARACRLLGPSALDDELDGARSALRTAERGGIGPARARATDLALRASAAVAVRTGSRAVLMDQHAQRLVREATFLLVFGSRPPMRDALLDRLGAAGLPLNATR